MKIILGAGMTGLAAGFSSRMPVFEASSYPGGICSSYYMHEGDSIRLTSKHPEDKEAFRFEVGGGHWIFGDDPLILSFIHSMVPIKTYARKSSVYFSNEKLFVPYPVQHHLGKFDPEFTVKALVEIVQRKYSHSPSLTMADSLRDTFGPSLCELFFDPFHELYTAGLWRKIAPLDLYKSPIDTSVAIRGAFEEILSDGYNKNFIYPLDGLDSLARHMADKCDVRYGKQVVSIDVNSKRVIMMDGSDINFEMLISTLPLNRMIEMSGLEIHVNPDPYTSVLVINIGAVRGHNCPGEHWIYTPQSKAGFHRVGFYSNVDPSFLPSTFDPKTKLVSLYIEKAYVGGNKPNDNEIKTICNSVFREIQDWGWIENIKTFDTTWIDVAYTWSWPNSLWATSAIRELEKHNIFQVGRYGRWTFQGIANSIRDGLLAGATFIDR